MSDSKSTTTTFRVLEHSGDLKLEAWGGSDLEALAHASQGIITQIVSLENIFEREQITIEVRGDDEISRIISFFNELLYFVYVKRWIPKRVRQLKLCNSVSCDTLQAVLSGESYDSKRHELKLDIKAVTYHDFSISREPEKTTIRFVCDL